MIAGYCRIKRGETIMNIEQLLKEPESKTLEYKRDITSLSPILKTIVAFANTAGVSSLLEDLQKESLWE